MAHRFPRNDALDSDVFQVKVDGKPSTLDFGGMPVEDKNRIGQRLRRIERERWFFGEVHSKVGGTTYLIRPHRRHNNFYARFIRAYWLRENDTDPDLEQGDKVIVGYDVEGRYCFFTATPSFVPFTGTCRIDSAAANQDTAYANQNSITMDEGDADPKYILAKLRHPVTVPYDETTWGDPFCLFINYLYADVEFAFGGAANARLSMQVGYRIWAVTSDFETSGASCATYDDLADEGGDIEIQGGNLSAATAMLPPTNFKYETGMVGSAGYPMSASANPTDTWTPDGNFILYCYGRIGPVVNGYTNNDWDGYGTVYGILIGPAAGDQNNYPDCGILTEPADAGDTTWNGFNFHMQFQKNGSGIWMKAPWWT